MKTNETEAADVRQSDSSWKRRQLQRLAIAAGMTLSDGSPIVVGSAKCPQIGKIKDAIGFEANRMTREQYSDARDDYGATRPYFASAHGGGNNVEAILSDWSGLSDCDGEMSMRDYLQICG